LEKRRKATKEMFSIVLMHPGAAYSLETTEGIITTKTIAPAYYMYFKCLDMDVLNKIQM
jgi:hypothetical protein